MKTTITTTASKVVDGMIFRETTEIVRGVERILSAANLYQRLDSEETLIVPGVRHFCPVMRQLVLTLKGTVIKTPEISQGFLTTHYRFVDRIEGLAIAKACGQVGPDKDWPYDELFSEDYS